MKVVLRRKGGDWVIGHGRGYRNEAHLQDLLAESPVLIPFEDVSKEILTPRVMIREFGLPGSGSSDIVGIDEQGGITVIECKLAANPEIKRKVVGQTLEYAGFLWQKPYQFVDERSLQRLGKPLAHAIEESLDEEGQKDWDEPDFVKNVSATLLSGDFQLIIAVDNLNEELRRTVRYLNEGPSNLRLFVLEVGFFSSDEGEILVPRLHGPSSKQDTAGTPKPAWDFDRFFEDARERELAQAVIDALTSLYEFTESEASAVHWGRGAQTGSFTFHYLEGGAKFSLFSVYSEGRVQPNIGYLRKKVSTEILNHYVSELRSIEGFRAMKVKKDFKSWPYLSIEKCLPDTDSIERFKEIVIALRDRIAGQG